LCRDDDNYYVISEFLYGDLQDELEKQGRFNEHDTSHIINQVLLGTYYLHMRDVIHRDLKPANVLWGDAEKTFIKIADFGLAEEMPEGKTYYNKKVGTPHFKAPEMIKIMGKYNNKIDVWAIGVMAY